jgi:hypothetical protein
MRLNSDQTLHLLDILSWEKNSYVCAKAELDGAAPVLAMVFFGRHAKRCIENHRIALDCLRRMGQVKVPSVENVVHDDCLISLMNMSEFMTSFRDVRAMAALSSDARKHIVIRVLQILGALHRVGVGSDDLDIAGFLSAQGRLEYIPLQPLKRFTHHGGMPLAIAMKNLAQLLAQCPPDIDRDLPEFRSAYAASSGLDLPSVAKIQKLCLRYRRRNVHRRLVETENTSREFAVYRTLKQFAVVSRSHLGALQEFLSSPETCMVEGKPLKLGTTNTVMKVDLGGRSYVVKRYNLKNLRVFFSRLPKVSRSLKAWRATQAFWALGVPTAEPIALVRERLGPLYFRSWMVTEYIDAPHFGEFFSNSDDNFDLLDPQRETLLRFFQRMVAGKLSHGDLKCTNLLWHQNYGPISIDMDAARYHGGGGRIFERYWRKDRRRFLMNWPSDTLFYRWLDQHLPSEKMEDAGRKGHRLGARP